MNLGKLWSQFWHYCHKFIALVFVINIAYSEATLEAALLCFKYHKESNTTYQERLQLLSYVQQPLMHVRLPLVL